MQHQQAAAVAEERLDLDPADQALHALEHVGRPEQRVAGGLGGGVGDAVARGLAHLVGDQRDRLGLPEPQAAAASPPGELGGEEEEEAVLLAREEPHAEPVGGIPRESGPRGGGAAGWAAAQASNAC